MPIGVARQVNRAILTATIGFAAAALAGLIATSILLDGHRGVATSLVYGLCLLACSLCSYLYNMLETSPRRWLLRYLDHAAIFLLIAGTYTPFVAGGIRGPLGIGLLEWVWGLALAGIALKLLLRGRHDRFFVAIYLALGWLFLSALAEFVALNSLPCLVLLAVGGSAYTVGAMIYFRGIGHWTDPVWHGCVLIGSLTHFAAVLFLVAGPQTS